MLGNIRCAVPFCKESAATSFCSQVLCVTHFISRCYERLDSFESLKGVMLTREGAASLRDFLIECSQRTMDICLSRDNLDNLDRARLLDILLRVTDIASVVLDGPQGIATYPFAGAAKATASSGC
jgi:hypothetical protein